MNSAQYFLLLPSSPPPKPNPPNQGCCSEKGCSLVRWVWFWGRLKDRDQPATVFVLVLPAWCSGLKRLTQMAQGRGKLTIHPYAHLKRQK